MLGLALGSMLCLLGLLGLLGLLPALLCRRPIYSATSTAASTLPAPACATRSRRRTTSLKDKGRDPLLESRPSSLPLCRPFAENLGPLVGRWPCVLEGDSDGPGLRRRPLARVIFG